MVEISYGAALGLALGYLLGSIPFGIVLTRLAGAGDLRSIGSGNIGATNVLRTGRKGLAAATLMLDALKATLAVVLAAWAFGPSSAPAAALAATAISPLVALLIGLQEAAVVFWALAALVWVKHSANIARLLRGAEPKIGQG